MARSVQTYTVYGEYTSQLISGKPQIHRAVVTEENGQVVWVGEMYDKKELLRLAMKQVREGSTCQQPQ